MNCLRCERYGFKIVPVYLKTLFKIPLNIVEINMVHQIIEHITGSFVFYLKKQKQHSSADRRIKLFHPELFLWGNYVAVKLGSYLYHTFPGKVIGMIS